MILISIQMRKQFSTPGKVTKVFLGDRLKGEKSRRKLYAKINKRKEERLGHGNTCKYWAKNHFLYSA